MGDLRNRMKWVLQPFLWRAYRWYYSKPRTYQFEGLQLNIRPSVFHPALFISTQFLLAYVREQALTDKSLLELGCGSGLISLCAAREGARVVASDINPQAIDGLKANADTNQLDIQCLQSDLFQSIPKQSFDYIVINPPYYPKQPSNNREQAFYCGEDFSYFRRLYAQLADYVHSNSKVIMVLSEDCDLAQIQTLAQEAGYQFQEVRQLKKVGEWNYLFLIKRIDQ